MIGTQRGSQIALVRRGGVANTALTTMLYRLIVLTGPLKNQRITVDQEPMAIGHAAECQIVLPDDEVAAQHAILEHRPESGLHIRDLGTMHRLIVNGRELRESRLKHGDMVEIGRTRFLVQAVVAAEVAGKDADPDERTNPKLILLVALVLVMAFVTWRRWPQTHPVVAPPKAEPEPAAVVIEQGASNVPPLIAEQTNLAAVVAMTETNAPVVVAVATTSLPLVVANVATASVPVVPVSTPVPPSDNTATQVTAEIQKIREDLLAMRQTMQDLKRPPIVITAAPPPVAVAPSNVPALAMTNSATVVSTNLSVTAGPVGRIMRVLNVEQMRFPASDDFDEMRTFNIALNLTNPRVTIANEDVEIGMTFYDEELKDGTVMPSPVASPQRDLRPSQPWGADRRNVASATLTIPKGAREKERSAGRDAHYYGFVVRVLYRGEFQDEWAIPHALLTQAQSSNSVVNASAQKKDL